MQFASPSFQDIMDAHIRAIVAERDRVALKALEGQPEGSTVAIRFSGDAFEYRVNPPGDHAVPDPRFCLLGKRIA